MSISQHSSLPFLQTLKNWVRYSGDIWNTLLWDTTNNNYCWLGVCDNHQKESNLVPRKPLEEMTYYGQWESALVDKNKDNKKKLVKSENESDQWEETEKKKKKTRLKINRNRVYVDMVLTTFPFDFSSTLKGENLTYSKQKS